MAPKVAKWKLDESSDQPIYFWKPEDPYGYFCQWYLCDITEDGVTFNCCEQYMMYHKAKLFNDTTTMTAILGTTSAKKQKSLGKKASGFNDVAWNKVKYDIVVRANSLKFRSGNARPSDRFVYPPEGKNPEDETVLLSCLLLATGDRELAEASKFDRVWGIGYAAEDADNFRKSWGENLLGKALMDVRTELRKEMLVQEE